MNKLPLFGMPSSTSTIGFATVNGLKTETASRVFSNTSEIQDVYILGYFEVIFRSFCQVIWTGLRFDFMHLVRAFQGDERWELCESALY